MKRAYTAGGSGHHTLPACPVMIKTIILSLLTVSCLALLAGCGREPSGIAVSDGAVSEVEYASLEELEAAAELVVVGTPTGLEGFKTTAISTMATISVEEVLKGEPLETLVVVQEGGEAQNEVTPPPEEFPLLETGKRYLLYLNGDYIRDGETCYTVVGGYQGVAVDSGGEWTALSAANGLFPYEGTEG